MTSQRSMKLSQGQRTTCCSSRDFGNFGNTISWLKKPTAQNCMFVVLKDEIK